MKILQQQLWEVLVPAERDGTEIPVDYHREWDDNVRSIAGGLTIMRTAKGQWESDEGELFSERMIPVRVACSREQIEEIMQITLRHYGQLAVMAYRISEESLILESE